MKKFFVLGVGCQKGGTTWLYKQLIKSKFVDLGYAKEYHVFDTVYTPDLFNNKDALLEMLKYHLTEESKAPINLLRQLLFLEDVSTYYHYFNELWHSKQNTKIVGDITPSYCCLKAEHLSMIKNRLEELDFSIKVIFIMRDPVQRLWSACRHEKRFNPSVRTLSDNDLLLMLYKHPQFEARSRYDITIHNIEKVFKKEDIFYCFYEDLFTSNCVNKLSHFLEIDESIFDTSEYVNATTVGEDLMDTTVEQVVQHYSSVYKFVEARFSITKTWDSYKYISEKD